MSNIDQLTTEQREQTLASLFQKGKLVKIHISQWSMWAGLAKDEIATTEVIPDIIKPGAKRLIKKSVMEEFKRIEGQARNYLRRNSFDFFSDALVPIPAYLEVMTQLDTYKDQFEAAADNLLVHYEEYQTDMMQTYHEWADRLVGCYPTKETLRSKFRFTIISYEITMPTNMEKIDVHEMIAREQTEQEVAVRMEARIREQQDAILKQAEQCAFEAAHKIRDKIGAIATSLILKVKAGHVVTKTNRNTLTNLVKDFRNMNLLDDVKMAEQITSLESVLDKHDEFKNNTSAVEELDSVLSSIKVTAENASDVDALTGEFFRKLTIC